MTVWCWTMESIWKRQKDTLPSAVFIKSRFEEVMISNAYFFPWGTVGDNTEESNHGFPFTAANGLDDPPFRIINLHNIAILELIFCVGELPP